MSAGAVRKGNWSAEIDESLFDNKSKTRQTGQITRNKNDRQRQGQGQAQSKEPNTIIKAKQLENIRKVLEAAEPASASAGAQSSSSSLSSSSSKQNTGSGCDSTLSPCPSAAQLHRQRIISLSPNCAAFEDERAAGAEDLAERAALIGAAASAKLEEHDAVKNMNQIMLYAQCVTIRDAQLAEKAARLAAERAAETKSDAEMEAARLAAALAEEAARAQREAAQRVGARVILTQIAEREHERLLAAEARECEAAAMLAHVASVEAADEERRVKKIEKGKAVMKEVMKWNQLQAAQKMNRRELELAEERKRLSYIEEKENRERAKEEEIAALRAAKEREIAALRARQERAADRQAELDEIRARRYQQEKDRQMREATLRALEEKERKCKEMECIRNAQAASKARAAAEEKEKERAEYNRIGEYRATQLSEEAARSAAKAEEQRRHAAAVAAQIADAKQRQDEAKRRYVQEGARYVNELEQERIRLEAIKSQKLAQLEKMGVPDKYRQELRNKNIAAKH